MKRNPVLWLLLSGAFVMIIWLSSSTVVTTDDLANMVTAVLPVERGQFLVFWRQVWWLFVKGWHATEFGLLYWLVFLLARRVSHRGFFAGLVSVTLAFLDEIHQVSIPARGGRLSDVLIDAIGITLAAYFLSRNEKSAPIPWWGRLTGAATVLALIWALAMFPFGGFG